MAWRPPVASAAVLQPWLELGASFQRQQHQHVLDCRAAGHKPGFELPPELEFD